MIKIAPSILSCDYSIIGEELKRMEKSGADLIHVDVMDGHFVPNITLGAPIVKCIRKTTRVPFDVHLMISEPLKYVPDFLNAGADIITFHVEAVGDAGATIDAIIKGGAKAGISVKPKTPINAVYPYLDRLSMVLIMTVEPGFGGQSFMKDMMPKIEELTKELKRRNLSPDIQVDGGINEQTISIAAKSGANVFVSGNALFGSDDAKAAITRFKELATQ